MTTPSTFLLDTNIVLALLRDNALGKAVDRAYALSGSQSRNLLSVVSVGELLSFAARNNWQAQRRARLEKALQELVWVDINDQLTLDAYARIDAVSIATGHKMGQNDLWIAACTLATGATLLTTDRDFDHLEPTHIRRIWIDPNTNDNA